MNWKPAGWAYTSPDGQRFIVNSLGDEGRRPLVLVTDWASGSRQRHDSPRRPRRNSHGDTENTEKFQTCHIYITAGPETPETLFLVARMPAAYLPAPSCALMYSRVMRAMLEIGISFGQTASHSPSFEQLPNPSWSA